MKWIVQRAEDVTAFVHSRLARQLTEEFTEREKGMAAELYARVGELHRLNQELRQAHARERQVAVALQEAMLSATQADPRAIPDAMWTSRGRPSAVAVGRAGAAGRPHRYLVGQARPWR
ncbi:hypothetical protein [Streptomyces agglomeratus]|uniref:hypothetical protein n=1 Tax=Streptomyces agglomeratus TaxID=285458 RepID=UPI000B2413D7|nr:hypothetical protein [Streptomyces agglomeratus]